MASTASSSAVLGEAEKEMGAAKREEEKKKKKKKKASLTIAEDKMEGTPPDKRNKTAMKEALAKTVVAVTNKYCAGRSCFLPVRAPHLENSFN